MVIVGSAVGDNRALGEPLGTVRAFDTRTGAVRWSWNAIPQSAADPAWKEWQPEDAKRTGAANAWAPISVDPQNDLVFVPTGSASPDYYGGMRRGPGPYSDSLVVLHAKTGAARVVLPDDASRSMGLRQPVAAAALHDPAQRRREFPAVVQGTKRGILFVFNRVTGEPLFPIAEKPVPQSDVPGEQTSPTQPFPDFAAAAGAAEFHRR